MKHAVILAGGAGTRLRERLNGRPKPLVDVAGVPLLQRQMDLLASHGFERVTILVNYAADQIRSYCATNAAAGLDLRIVDDGSPRGTSGAVMAVIDELADRFMVLYGDTLLDVDLDRLWADHARRGADATLVLHPNDHPHDSDIVDLDDDGRVVGFHSYPHAPDALLPNLVNAALFVVERAALLPWRDEPVPSDFAKTLFPKMLARGQTLRGYVTFEYIKDIGTPTRLDKAVRHLLTGVVERARLDRKQRAVMIDRDGTLNVSAGYVRCPDELVLIPGAAYAIRRLNEAEYRTVVVTNQPVIARGDTTVEGLHLIHNKLEKDLGREGAYLDRILYCPHHPDRGFSGEVAALKIRCECRKPEIGLISRAVDALNVDVGASWFIGDTTGDLLAARRSGLRSILVETGEAGRDGRYMVTPDIVVPDVAAAAAFIIDVAPRLADLTASVSDAVEPGDIVLVGGAARAGKSTTSAALAWQLRGRGIDTRVLPIDRYLVSAADRGDGGVLSRYDIDILLRDLRPWLDGGAANLSPPWYDRWARTSQPDPEIMTLGADTVLILEGVPALLMTLRARRQERRVFVETDLASRSARVVADLQARGMSQVDAEATDRSRDQDELHLVLASAKSAQFTLNPDAALTLLAERRS